jgi:hypothetical protein
MVSFMIQSTTPCERDSSTHSMGGRVGPRASLDIVEKKKFCPCREMNPGCQKQVANHFTATCKRKCEMTKMFYIVFSAVKLFQ